MKLLIYSLNTFIIQVLGNINIWLYPLQKRWTRPERLCYGQYEDNNDGYGKVVHISCCDCGASHHFWKANDGIYGIPVRPKGYKYSVRLRVDTCFASEEEKRRWNIRR